MTNIALDTRCDLLQDSNYQYQQSCALKGMHQAVSLVGCFDGNVAFWLCGIDLERRGPDWSEVKFTGNLFYPRTLVHAMPDINGDGKGTAEVKCSDPLDCANRRVTAAFESLVFVFLCRL